MNATTHPVARTPVPRDDRDVRLAWACLACGILAVIASFVVGGAIGTALGVEEGALASTSVALLVLAVVVALLAVPVLLVWRFANRARARGDARGRVPAIVLTVLAAVVVGVNLLSWLAGVVLDGA